MAATRVVAFGGYRVLRRRFIKRDPATGKRTHHIHMVEADFATHWERLVFRDYLIAHPEVASRYDRIKRELASEPGMDRVRYTEAKGAFISQVMAEADRAGGTQGSEQKGRKVD